ncbi:ATP-binding cassette domain-containing protein [Pyrobaculum aerophilum]|uniref:Phosphate import ATP-binding protein PstB n=2 Tax=Pyrobaculum aerophilum TaxID=13773 RepID=PSTB_PYRAE|nr:ATP-binding cassette domain-containing protein [Pyrobaculum aerophilum]Q8ZX91.1 RecName: Full=Phosphate import ATP-binding protein PstB; AltName: Full=ABC phosphate transporter; AltName: Full=Phosphate-transporting ATPase [Pyrobaculum aerophilum str. IM2]AAL63458.1 phosphate ABC transporter, ATP-binding protein [Pyrobaculum aerophilum str. IM2]MCX8135698.1 ATP-binding cassette domain-containing protein [Pyrobaculum aerophilum]RFA96108.1 phosphate ABC transporter ATP-binding protein [Pyrobacu
MAKLTARDLKLSFGNVEVLKGVNLEIKERTITALMGPSGSGKSTLLRVFNRLIELYPEARVSGEVLLDGQDVFKMDVIELRRRVQMIFQIPNPIPNLSIFENVALGLKLNRIVKSKKELEARVRQALEKAQLWDEVKNRLDAPAGKLSGGQQQRLCVARALAFDPEVLLADEPTANLDPENTAKLESLFLELKKDMTIVLVTHFPAQAARVSDYVAFLYKGQIVEVGPTKEVFTNPRHELTEKYVTGKLY